MTVSLTKEIPPNEVTLFGLSAEYQHRCYTKLCDQQSTEDNYCAAQGGAGSRT